MKGLSSICLILISINACSSDTSPREQAPFFERLGLNGTWENSCSHDELGSFKSEAVLLGDVSKRTFIRFDGRDCKEANKRFSYMYQYFEATELEPDLEGFVTVQQRITRITATPHNKASLKIYRDANAFGFDDWQINVAKDVTGRKYDEESTAMPSTGSPRVHSFRAEKDKIIFASYNNKGLAVAGDTPDLIFTRK